MVQSKKCNVNSCTRKLKIETIDEEHCYKLNELLRIPINTKSSENKRLNFLKLFAPKLKSPKPLMLIPRNIQLPKNNLSLHTRNVSKLPTSRPTYRFEKFVVFSLIHRMMQK